MIGRLEEELGCGRRTREEPSDLDRSWTDGRAVGGRSTRLDAWLCPGRAGYLSAPGRRHQTAAQVVANLDRYAAGFEAPIQEGIEVTAISSGRRRGFPPGDLGRRDHGRDGGPQHRRLSAAAPTGGRGHAPEDLHQIDVEDYRNPAELPSGPVLVVGSGQSGCQIAEELHEGGREVFLACGRAPWFPRRLGDRDVSWWALETGFLDAPVSSLPSQLRGWPPMCRRAGWALDADRKLGDSSEVRRGRPSGARNACCSRLIDDDRSQDADTRARRTASALQ